jgi:ABC-type Fe3+-hydroxamate transport system substrate-binding protein
MPEDLNALKTDIALIKSDVKQIGRFFDKVDKSVSCMAEIQQSLAVQKQIIENFDDKLATVEDRVEDNKILDEKRSAVLGDRMETYRVSSREDHQRIHDQNRANRKERNDEILAEMAKLSDILDRRITQIENKLGGVERWKFYMMGISAALVFIISKLDIKSFIG